MRSILVHLNGWNILGRLFIKVTGGGTHWVEQNGKENWAKMSL